MIPPGGAVDDDLILFAAEGAPPLPAPAIQGRVEHQGASLWYAAFVSG